MKKQEKIKRFSDFWSKGTDFDLDMMVSGMFGTANERIEKIIEMLDYLAEEIEGLKDKLKEQNEKTK